MPPAQVLDRHTGISFAQEADDLFFRKTLLHVQSPRVKELDSKLRCYSKSEGRRVEQMTRVLAELRDEGSNISPEVLAGLSPYRTSHINRFGDYTLDLKRQVEPIDFSRRILAATTR